MLRPISLTLIVILLCSIHVEAEEKKEEVLPIVGIWLLSAMQVNGEAVEDDDIGSRIFVFADDGTMEVFENFEDYSNEKADDKGWYELDDEGNVLFFEDVNKDGKLGEDEMKRPDVFIWAFDEEVLTLSNTINVDGEKMTIAVNLKPYQFED